MRERSQKGCKNKKDKKVRSLSKERKVLQSRKQMNEGTEGRPKKETILKKVGEGNAQNSLFERLIFRACAFKQDSVNVFCLSDWILFFYFTSQLNLNRVKSKSAMNGFLFSVVNNYRQHHIPTLLSVLFFCFVLF